MTKDITPQAPKDLQQPGFDVLSPLASQALFWRARYSAPSPVLNHLPLLFWLCETIRPRVTLTLGVADAVPHFALCQAVETLGLESLCFGVDPIIETSESDDEAAAPEPADLSEIRAFNDRNFADFSMIQQQMADQGPALPSECKIDFLVINQPASQTLFDSLETTWLPLMSERGVVVFLQGGQIAGYESYLRRLSQSDGVYVIDPETRASLVLSGPDQNERLQRLAQLRIGQPGYLAARKVFTRLGEIHSKSSRLEQAEQDAITTAETQAENARLTEKIAELETQTAKLTEQLKERSAKVATAQADAFDAQQSAAELKAQVKANAQWQDKAQIAEASLQEEAARSQTLTRELEQARSENSANSAALQALQQQLSDRTEEAKVAAESATLLNAELSAVKTQLETSDAEQKKLQSMTLQQEKDLGERYDDIATLGLEIQDQEKSRKAAEDEIEHLKHRLGETERDRDERAHRVEALEDSTSWRITAPLRKVSSSLRR